MKPRGILMPKTKRKKPTSDVELTFYSDRGGKVRWRLFKKGKLLGASAGGFSSMRTARYNARAVGKALSS